MHSLINLTHTRKSGTRKKTARVSCLKKGHHKPTKRNKTQTIITHNTQEGPSHKPDKRNKTQDNL